MDGATRLKVVDLNKNLTCILCKGYLVDATSIIECLHSFCRTCIVTYLKTSKSCPTCDTVVHKTRPHQNIRSDKLLQDLVYKLVPSLYKDEMRRRREFYTAHYEDAPKRPGEERGDEMCDRFIFTPDEQISLALHFCPQGGDESSFKSQVFRTKEEYKSRLEKKTKESIDVRYLQCKAAVTVGLLKKFLRLKYDLPPHYQIEMFNNDEFLNDTSSLADVAYTCSWRRKGPLRMSFSIYENAMRSIKWGESLPKLSHSSCLKWRPLTVSAPCTSSSIPLPTTDKVAEVLMSQVPMKASPLKSNEPRATDFDKQPLCPKDIKEEVASPPNGFVPLKPKANTVPRKVPDNVERKSNKRSLLGKRPAKSPIRIAPAPARDGPILKMPKMIKLETNVQNGRPPTIQQVMCPSSSFSPASSHSTAVPLFPLVSSSLIPTHLRNGQPSVVKAFPGRLMAIPAVPSKQVNLCRFTSNPGVAPPPGNVTVTRTFATSATNHSQPRSISKALSSLSLSSPPLPTTTTSHGIAFSQSLPSPALTTLSFSVKSTPASTAFSTTIPVTSIASPTPAASASPTPAAIPSQQSQTQGTDGHAVSKSNSSSSQTAVSNASQDLPSTVTTIYLSSSVNGNSRPNIPIHPHQLPTSRALSCPNGLILSKPPISAISASNNSLTNTIASTKAQSIALAASPNTPTLMASQNTNGHHPIPTPPSSGGGSCPKKQVKPKKIADVANKLHKRVSQTAETQNTPKRSQSPKRPQQLEFTALKPNHQDSSLFNMNGRNSPLTSLGVAIKQGQPLTSSLFDPKSMHPNLINGRLEEPLNLVKRDKDYRLAPGLTRSELPPVVK